MSITLETSIEHDFDSRTLPATYIANAVHQALNLSTRERRHNSTPLTIQHRRAVLLGRLAAWEVGSAHHNILLGEQLGNYGVPHARRNVHSVLQSEDHPPLFGAVALLGDAIAAAPNNDRIAQAFGAFTRRVNRVTPDATDEERIRIVSLGAEKYGIDYVITPDLDDTGEIIVELPAFDVTTKLGLTPNAPSLTQLDWQSPYRYLDTV